LPQDWADYLNGRLEKDKVESAQSVSAFVEKNQKMITDITATKHCKVSVNILSATTSLQKMERESTFPAQPLSFPIRFITDIFDTTAKYTKVSTSQYWQRNFGTKCKK